MYSHSSLSLSKVSACSITGAISAGSVSNTSAVISTALSVKLPEKIAGRSIAMPLDAASASPSFCIISLYASASGCCGSDAVNGAPMQARNILSRICNSLRGARSIPSTEMRIISLPTFTDRKIRAMTPTFMQSCVEGTSTVSSICITRNILLSACIASLTALRAASLPTSILVFTPGKTAIPRVGIAGITINIFSI